MKLTLVSKLSQWCQEALSLRLAVADILRSRWGNPALC